MPRDSSGMIEQVQFPRDRSTLARDRRGVVALWVAVTTPVVVMGLGLGVDVTEWVIANQQLQRAADAASTAGALRYGTVQNAQIAAGIAADVAEANGAAGAATRTWTAATTTLVDNTITVVVGPPVVAGNNASVAVTVKKSVQPTFSKVFATAAKVVTASGTADSTGTITVFQQPCLLTLGKLSATTPDVSINGSSNVQLTGCSIVSNEEITIGGSAYVNVGTAYAKSNIVITGSGTLVGTQVPNSTLNLSDPYAGNASLTTAFGILTNGSTIVNGTTLANRGSVSISGSGTNTLSPGIYTSLSIGGSPTVTFQPGLYVVKGTMSIGGSPVVSGSDVTFINGSSLTVSGSPRIGLTAPTTATVSGASMVGVLFASNVANSSASTFQLGGSEDIRLAGLIYFPGTNIAVTGSPEVDTNDKCLEIIANVITVTGSPSLENDGCNSMGVLQVHNDSTSNLDRKLER